jgi:hypothetical protein
MNERIKEIAEQVGKYISTTNFEGMPEDGMTYDEIFQKKFAELIVRECSRVARQLEVGTNRVCEAIEKHFGVEE